MTDFLLSAILSFAIIVGLYVALAIFLNKFNLLVYKKKTALAWIPICNVYLLGKLAVNKLVGWILVGLIILTGNYTVTVNNISTTYTLLPAELNRLVQSLYDVAIIGLLVYGIIKYNNLKDKSKKEQSLEQVEQTTENV